ncbi:hypothetical protein HBI56_008940 [Parastagonospora nodorum]|nr:hypothetical protein HBH53_077640 [Parastagonospora nodorum]KAH3987223.1 hypothetical protein HBH51_010690 [Parastagonospora nodorum]KAH3987317.1 hypothetical protein HBH52_036730 [Parastagonospora nodorum]KAH4001205.1 hypothetical protein HBI10_096390 [Parastagonospora nodorum]KAH4033339.1 hypothetical protein HBI13_009360 [Parastagonospora nodorum]
MMSRRHGVRMEIVSNLLVGTSYKDAYVAHAGILSNETYPVIIRKVLWWIQPRRSFLELDRACGRCREILIAVIGQTARTVGSREYADWPKSTNLPRAR